MYLLYNTRGGALSSTNRNYFYSYIIHMCVLMNSLLYSDEFIELSGLFASIPLSYRSDVMTFCC